MAAVTYAQVTVLNQDRGELQRSSAREMRHAAADGRRAMLTGLMIAPIRVVIGSDVSIEETVKGLRAIADSLEQKEGVL